MADSNLTLGQVKEALDRLSEEVSAEKHPTALLKDLKLSVDHLRLSLWAMIASGNQGAHGPDSGLGSNLVEFRMERLIQMLDDFREDLRGGEVIPSHPVLVRLSSVLQSTLETIRLRSKSLS